MTTLLLLVALTQTDPELVEAIKKLSIAAEKSAEAAERSAKAAEAAAGILPQEAPGAKPAAPPPLFSGSAGVSLVYLAGNSNALTASALVGLQLNLDPWLIALNASGAYGQSRASGATSDQVTALQAFAELRGGRTFNEILGAYVLAGTGFDRVAKIEWRAYGEAGATVTFVKKKEGDFLKLLLTADLGVRYQQESWFIYYVDANFTNTGRPDPAGKRALPLKLGVNFRYALHEGLVFGEQIEILPDVLNINNININSNTTLSVKIVGPLALQTGFLLRYNGNPAPGAKNLDTQLSLAATVSF